MLFTEEELDFQEQIKALYRESILPVLNRNPGSSLIADDAKEILQLVKPYGLLGARVPKEYGGTELGALKLGLAAEILPYEVWELISLPEIVAFRIATVGTEDLKRRLIPRLVGGELLAGSATSEYKAGSDPQSIQATAEKTSAGYRLQGTKAWCAGAGLAEVLLVVASTGTNSDGRNNLTPFILLRDESPFVAKRHTFMGLNRCQIAEVELDCDVPAENLLGERSGEAAHLLNKTWLSQRPIMGICSNTISNTAFEEAVRYAKERTQFGKKIGEFQLVQSMVADMSAMIDASRLLCFRAIRLAESGQDCMRETATAKYYAVKSSLEVTNLASEVCGAQGVQQGRVTEKAYRDARTLAFIEGTMEIQKLIMGREILGYRAFR